MVPTVALADPVSRRNDAQRRISALSAHYNALWDRIRTADIDASSSMAISVMGCAPRAGASTVAFNLAVTVARIERDSVLYVSTDTTTVSKCGGISAPPLGIVDVLAGVAAPLECCMPTSCEELCILSGRGTSSGAASSIDRKRFAEILGEYKRHFGAVIVDIPAPTESTSSILLASETDGVVLVVEAEQADARVALRAKQSLLDARANIVGVVLNKRRQHVPGWLYRLL